MIKLIEAESFVVMLSYAKAVAQSVGRASLDIPTIRVGTFVAVKAGVVSLPHSISELIGKLVKDAATEIGADLGHNWEPVSSVQMPLDPGLRALIKRHSNSSFDTFIENALGDQASEAVSQNSGTVGGESAWLNRLYADESFVIAGRYASAVVVRRSVADLSPKLLLAGAWLAFEARIDTLRPAIRAQLSASESIIKTLLMHEGWGDISGTQPLAAGDSLPIGKDVHHAVAATEAASDPLVVILNSGIKDGNDLRMAKRTAYHEAGHALVSLLLRPEVRLAEISIRRNDDSDGHVSYEKTSPWFSAPTSKEDVRETLCVCLAGRVAEQRQFGHDAADAGAVHDLGSATKLAWEAIAVMGLDDEVGPVRLDALSKTTGFSSGWLFDLAQRRLQALLSEALTETQVLIEQHWATLERIAQLLFERKELAEDDIQQELQRSGLLLGRSMQ